MVTAAVAWLGCVLVGKGAIARVRSGRRGGEAERGCAGCDGVQRHGGLGGLYPRAAR